MTHFKDGVRPAVLDALKPRVDGGHFMTPTPTDKPVGRSLDWVTNGTTYPFQSPWFDLRTDDVHVPQRRARTVLIR